MALDEKLRTRLLVVFTAEAEEHLNSVNACLAALERSLPEDEHRAAVEGAFRAVHTLKGAARSVGLREVEAVCQELEQSFGDLKRGRVELTRGVLAHLRERLDVVSRLLRTAGSDVPEAEARALASQPPSIRATESVRVAAARLESLHLRAEELLSVKLSIEERAREAHGLAETLDRWRYLPSASALAAERPGALRDVATQALALHERLASDRRVLGAAVEGLYEDARQVRMIRAASILEPLARMAGELARDQGKEARVELEGTDLEVDRRLLDAIKDPLLHLLRNAVDHGIEPPERRESLGKPRRGRLAIRARPLTSSRIEVSVEDDGAGIDVAGLRAAAVRSRVLGGDDATALGGEAALRLALVSGVSTSPVVTDLSGHGLGMAIARETVERLGGELLVETRAGEGTTLRLRLPPSVATFRGLLVRAGRQAHLIPLTAVVRVLRVAQHELPAVGGRMLLTVDGRALPAGALAGVLGRDDSGAPASGQKRPCVVLSLGEERGALLVDEVLGEREVLVKELRPPLMRVRHVAGAGLLGSGELVLILEPGDVMQTLRDTPREGGGSTEPSDGPPQAILVVDDSITTRTMERNLLEAAGYRVAVAVDGVEAWTALHTENFDLVVSDVDMPRMNGFDLTARIRGDAGLASLPVVLVTALESREEKERGVEVGANAYVIKSGFDQTKLLEIIGRLI
jgi:two-component system chemotaxis sensor kinase CheA